MVVLLILYLVLPAIQIYFFLGYQFSLGVFDILNFVSSILALHWILANVIIATKIPWLQRVIPYDKRIQFHILSTAGIVAAVVYHGVYKVALGYYLSPVTLTLMAVVGVVLATALLWIPLPGFRRFRNWLQNRFSRNKEQEYDKAKSFHGFIILVLGLFLLLHILGAGLFYEVPPLSALLYWGLYAVSFGLYLVVSRTGLFRTAADVLDVEERANVLTLRLQPHRDLRFKSGQFAFLQAQKPNGKKAEHPFSFLSSVYDYRKSAGGDGGEKRSKITPVSFAIKKTGDFTHELASLKKGDRVWVRGAFGNFRPRREEALCLIGSGIGIVPLISIVKELHHSGDSRPVRLFLAVNHRDEIPELEHLEEIAEAAETITIHKLVYTEDGQLYTEDYFRKTLGEPERYSYYLCSSPGVRSIVVNALSSLGVKKRSVHFEAFSFG